MKASTTAFLVLVASMVGAIGPARADKASDQVDEVLLAIFQSLEVHEDGVVRPRESDRMIQLTFAAMDANGDQRITPDEFKAFSMGFEYLAQVRDRLPAFNAAKAGNFKRWDTGSRGYLTLQEYTAGIKGDLAAAASKNDAEDSQLSVEDFKKVRFVRELIGAIQ